MADDIHSSVDEPVKKGAGPRPSRSRETGSSGDSRSTSRDSSVSKTNNMAAPSVKSRGEKRKDGGLRAKGSSSSAAATSSASSSSQEYASKQDLDKLTKQVNAMSNMMAEYGPRILEMSDAVKAMQATGYVSGSDDDEADNTPVNIGSENNDYLSSVVGEGSKTGPRIQENIAAAVNKVLSQGLLTSTAESLITKYPTPENCERLQVMSCNKAVYQGVSKKLRLEDKSLQTIQESLTKSLTACTVAYNRLSSDTTEDSQPSVRELVADCLSLAANASYKLDLFRRQNFKTDLSDDFSSICSGEKPVTGSLFGELSTEIKDCAEAAKLTKQIHRNRGRKFHPFGRGGYQKRWGGSRFNRNHSPYHQSQRKPYFRQSQHYSNNNNNNNNRKFSKRK